MINEKDKEKLIKVIREGKFKLTDKNLELVAEAIYEKVDKMTTEEICILLLDSYAKAFEQGKKQALEG